LEKQLVAKTRTDFLIQFVWQPLKPEEQPKDDQARQEKLAEILKQLKEAEEKQKSMVMVPPEQIEKKILAESKKQSEELTKAMEQAAEKQAAPAAAPEARPAGPAAAPATSPPGTAPATPNAVPPAGPGAPAATGTPNPAPAAQPAPR
jgi:hypothetical protein